MSSKEAIQDWWKTNPMTYGAVHGQAGYEDGQYELGTREFFNRVDREFYSWNKPLHGTRPFDKIFPYDQYKDKKVLEIGCGLGTMLMNWAKTGADCTGIDLNPTSIHQTKKRFELNNLDADIQLADSRNLPFPKETFDYVYSWGVLHHSPDLDKSIAEFFRVLKPGGQFGIMLYNRRSFYQWYMTDYVEGFLHDERKFLSKLELCSRYGDGHREDGNPHTWPVTKDEGLELIRPFCSKAEVKILGTDLDCVLRLMMPGIGKYLPIALKKSLARRWGWSLWFYGTKKHNR